MPKPHWSKWSIAVLFVILSSINTHGIIMLSINMIHIADKEGG